MIRVNFRGVIQFREIYYCLCYKSSINSSCYSWPFILFVFENLWRAYNTYLRTIDALLSPLSNNILIVCTLECLFSSEVPGLFWEIVEFLPRRLGGKITLKVMGNNSVALNDYSLLEDNLFFWLACKTRSNRHVV